MEGLFDLVVTPGDEGIIIDAREVSEARRVEEALRTSEERFRTSVEALQDGFAIFSSVRDSAEILLAEDEPADADLCLRALRRTKAANHIVWVKDGAEALDFLFARGLYTSRAGAARPRLLLLDIKMPKVDGFEVLRQIRADERLAAMPVVILTSSSEERDIIQAYHLG